MSTDYLSLSVHTAQSAVPYVPGKSIEELARDSGLRVEDIIKLASNESPLPSNPRVISAVHQALSTIARYPDDNGFELRRIIGKKYGVDPNGVTLGNGSNELLIMVARAFLERGRTAVFSQYAFSVYASATKSAGAFAREVPAKNFGNDLKGITEAIDEQTRVVYLANPNNPTGTWVEKPPFEEFLASVPSDVIIVLDEAYIEYADDLSIPNGLEYISRYPNLIVCRTLCKAHGLAGLRIGYAASSPQVANVLNRVRQPFNVNSLALAGACAALENDAYLEFGRRVNRDGLRQLQEGFLRLGLSWIPSQANFLTVDFGGRAQWIYDTLLANGIIVRPLVGYGLPDHLRISVGLESENRRLLDVLEQLLTQYL